eukprot:723433-Pyramimonas_sp.AAC.1
MALLPGAFGCPGFLGLGSWRSQVLGSEVPEFLGYDWRVGTAGVLGLRRPRVIFVSPCLELLWLAAAMARWW